MKRLLIANRGEIALRIIRSARTLGIETIAVYSEADRDSAHVAAADHAVFLGPAPARDSYLATEKVLAAAKSAGADAIHPGYGFLSENDVFAKTVTDAGMIWVGPGPDALRNMGDKDRARALAKAAGVPVVPGSARFAEGELEGAEQAAECVGYPLLVKASAGGGGIGMRRVDAPGSLADTIRSTQSMAKRAFGDGTVFLERYVPHARHIEIQVFGFGNGEAVHLFERDCSLQRRFQKIVEESPAPRLSDSVRTAMADAALALCRATRYSSAGTVEFIFDVDSNEFYFLEMNTRIQVEHPVTEMVTGQDLVAMQLKFASGTLTGLDQSEVASKGHSIQCRLYAENPEKKFFPSPGPLNVLRLPEQSQNLRIDCGYRQGDTITPHYDPMLAKIIAWGANRQAACDLAAQALQQVRVEGIVTNRDFLLACIEDPEFRAGNVHTGFVDEFGKRAASAAE